MNPITGEIVDIAIDGGVARARVRVGGAFLRVPLTLLMDACVGDVILIQSGVAIAHAGLPQRTEAAHVSGNSR